MTNLTFGSIGWNKYKSKNHDQKLKKFIKDLNEIDEKLGENKVKIDLLLCAGLTVDKVKKSKLKKKLVSLKYIKNILFEKYTDPNPESDSYETNYCIYTKKTNKLITFPAQLFETTYNSKATNTSITKQKSHQLAELILNGERTFKIQKQNFVLLVCGENNIIKGNKQETMIPLILKFHDKKSEIQKIINKSIIVNPSHYPYKINGKKRLEMMKNITKYPAKLNTQEDEYTIQVRCYLHSNNYSLGYKEMLKNENKAICSKYPNGGFCFTNGAYETTSFTYWNNSKSFIINAWEINIT